MWSPFAVLAVVLCPVALCKVFQRCDLVRELSKEEYRIPRKDIATWVCIARHESEFNSSAVGHLNAGSGDHGIFQISDLYWCSPPGVGKACGLGCDFLEDDDISDDIACARKIHRAHKRRSGDGFTAWAVYQPFCSGDVSGYARHCEHPEGLGGKETPYILKSQFSSGLDTVTLQASSSTYSTSYPVSTTARIISKTLTPYDKNKYALLRTTSHPLGRENSYEQSYGDEFSVKPVTFNPITALRKDESTSDARPRSFRTGSSRRPASRSGDLDPKTAWFRIHYDPRFLDELS